MSLLRNLVPILFSLLLVGGGLLNQKASNPRIVTIAAVQIEVAPAVDLPYVMQIDSEFNLALSGPYRLE
jgi:hypothetical protein